LSFERVSSFATPQHTPYTHTVNMPPKGSKKKAAVVAKTPTTPTRTDVPSVVVSKRGTEYDTTAAAARPRRTPAVVLDQAIANSKQIARAHTMTRAQY